MTNESSRPIIGWGRVGAESVGVGTYLEQLFSSCFASSPCPFPLEGVVGGAGRSCVYVSRSIPSLTHVFLRLLVAHLWNALLPRSEMGASINREDEPLMTSKARLGANDGRYSQKQLRDVDSRVCCLCPAESCRHYRFRNAHCCFIEQGIARFFISRRHCGKPDQAVRPLDPNRLALQPRASSRPISSRRCELR